MSPPPPSTKAPPAPRPRLLLTSRPPLSSFRCLVGLPCPLRLSGAPSVPAAPADARPKLGSGTWERLCPRRCSCCLPTVTVTHRRRGAAWHGSWGRGARGARARRGRRLRRTYGVGVEEGLTVDLHRPLRAGDRASPVCCRGTRHTPRCYGTGPSAFERRVRATTGLVNPLRPTVGRAAGL